MEYAYACPSLLTCVLRVWRGVTKTLESWTSGGNGDLKYDLFEKNIDNFTAAATDKPKYFVEWILYAEEKIEVLLGGALNKVNEIIFSEIDNESYHLKEILKQEDHCEFMKEMVKEMNTNERKNHYKIAPRKGVPEDIKNHVYLGLQK